MNWLAHLYLSEPDPAYRIGNLLPDILSRRELATCPREFQAGIQRHLEIDSFTDGHPVVKRCIARIPPPFRRFGGIIVDILFDHFLTIDWPLFAITPLAPFLEIIYRSFDDLHDRLPLLAAERLAAMRRGNWLNSYTDFDGLRCALNRTGNRLRRPVELGEALPLVKRIYPELRADFEEFFPQLRGQFTMDRVM